MLAWLRSWWLMLVLGGCALFFLAWREWRLVSASQSEPQVMSCAELGEKGPGSNAHVRMTDFMLCDWNYVYESRRDRWRGAWVPAIPLDGPDADAVRAYIAALPKDTRGEIHPPTPATIRVLVELPDARSTTDVENAAAADVLQGLVVNSVASVDKKTRDLLRTSYKSTDFDAVWIFERRDRPGAGAPIGYGAAGTAVLGLGVLFFRQRSAQRRRAAEAASAAAATPPAGAPPP